MKTQTGLDQNLAAACAYALGVASGVVFLIVEKENRFVRFHAMQSLLTFAAVAVFFLVLVSLPIVGTLLSIPCTLGVVALWVFLMVKAIQGEMFKLPFIGEWADHQLK